MTSSVGPLGRRRMLQVTSIALTVLGTILLGLAGTTLAYAQFQEWRYQAMQPAEPADIAATTVPLPLTPAPSTEPKPDASPTSTEVKSPEPPTAPAVAPSADPPSSATASALEESAPAAVEPQYGPPVWIRIPRIGVSSRVMNVTAVQGAYEVPAWDVGYHEDSAQPGSLGNAVFTGHVETINAGRIFARLGELDAGDRVTVLTERHRSEWEILDSVAVPRDENSYIYPSGDTRITLYTCTGRWDPLTQDYSHRRVVTGRLLEVQPRL